MHEVMQDIKKLIQVSERLKSEKLLYVISLLDNYFLSDKKGEKYIFELVWKGLKDRLNL